ncbi:MAG: GNAT family N-acetyltransferase [Anaerolineales bacterium]|nr:GNAT family N-acetyltransferase [Anaerolineales bacterium]
MKDILKGELVRLSAVDHEELGKAYAKWNQDSELTRYLDARMVALRSSKAISDFFEKENKEVSPMEHPFTIRALDDNRLLGDIGLYVVNNWGPRDAFVGLGIGNREDWGKGYGTDAMKVALGYAFTELNLRRVTLNVFEYNPRAIRSYEKVGFQHEGRMRKALLRDGKRWDMLYMGILRDDWMERKQ